LRRPMWMILPLWYRGVLVESVAELTDWRHSIGHISTLRQIDLRVETCLGGRDCRTMSVLILNNTERVDGCGAAVTVKTRGRRCRVVATARLEPLASLVVDGRCTVDTTGIPGCKSKHSQVKLSKPLRNAWYASCRDIQ